MTGVSLAELKAERCAQVSGADLLELSAQRRKSRRGLAKLLLVDVRPPEEYPFTNQVHIGIFYLLFNILCVHHQHSISCFFSGENLNTYSITLIMSKQLSHQYKSLKTNPVQQQ